MCVATYGDQPDFPAFYTPSSGMKVCSPLPRRRKLRRATQSSWMVSDASSAAQLIRKFCTSHPAHVLDASLGLPTPLSTLLAVPIPFQHTEAGDVVQKAVEQAVLESVQLGVDKRGKEVTPWLLKRVGELSGGVALDLSERGLQRAGSPLILFARQRRQAHREQRTGRSSSRA